MTPYTGSPLNQPHVECDADNGEFVEGIVVKADWLDGPVFDMDSVFIVQTDEHELIKVFGWNVTTTIVG